MGRRINKKNILIGIGIGIFLFILIFGYWYWVNIESPKLESAALQKSLEAMNEQVLISAYIRQSLSDYGGDTPAKTLYYYVEMLESKNYRLASTFFLRGNRSVELNHLTNASPATMKGYITLLKETITQIGNTEPKSETFSFNDPLPVIFNKVSNGVWQIESINYRL